MNDPVPAETAKQSDNRHIWQGAGPAAIGGIVALLGAVLAPTLTSYCSARSADTEKSAAARTELLSNTSAAVQALAKARGALKANNLASAIRLRRDVDRKYDAWMVGKNALKDKVRALIGSEAAELVYSSKPANLIVDRCNVVTDMYGPERDKDCAQRLAREVRVLTERQDRMNEGKSYSLDGIGVILPEDFSTNFTMARNLVHYTQFCKTQEQKARALPEDAPAHYRCFDNQQLQYVLNLRVNILGQTQGRIEEALR